MEPLSLFALVRGVPDLPRACDEISAFLSLRYGRRAAPLREALLGIWIDAGWVSDMPCELPWHEPPAVDRTARLRETAGIAGVWMLCWLEGPAGVPPPSRAALLESLLSEFARDRNGAPPFFVPVFALDAPADEAQAELRRLAAGYRDLLLAPIYQDPGSGRLQAPAVTLRRPPGVRD